MRTFWGEKNEQQKKKTNVGKCFSHAVVFIYLFLFIPPPPDKSTKWHFTKLKGKHFSTFKSYDMTGRGTKPLKVAVPTLGNPSCLSGMTITRGENPALTA